MRRKSSVAGHFYPGGEKSLRKMVEKMVDLQKEKKKALCVISPHAGFEYSGNVAGAVFSSVLIPKKLVILGPSHRSIQSRFAIMREGSWETPLGDVFVDTPLAELIMNRTNLVSEDENAHLNEHSLEVQLPFIQFFKKDFTFIPISIAYYASFDELVSLGKAIGEVIKEQGEEVLIVASTDMSHYVSKELAKEKDFLAIESILKLDAKGLYDVVTSKDISMCGFQPTTAAIIASKELGATKAELIKYQTSGDITGDHLEVVGYAGIRVE